MNANGSLRFSVSVSMVIVTYNSQKHLKECLRSVSWADEIVLMDLGSTDRTLDIANTFGCRIFKHQWVAIVEMVRQKVIRECCNDWVLVLDPDELVPPALAERLIEIASQNSVDAVSIPRHNLFFGRWLKYSGRSQDRHIRFFRKNAVETLPYVHSQPIVTGRILELSENEGLYILHYNYDDITQYLEKLNRYTTQELDRPENTTSSDITSLARAPFRELKSRFFEAEGYRDGLQGFVDCELMAFYRLVTGLKAIERGGWRDVPPGELMRKARAGMLLGMWDLVKGMEHSANSWRVRVLFRLLRFSISVGIRLHQR